MSGRTPKGGGDGGRLKISKMKMKSPKGSPSSGRAGPGDAPKRLKDSSPSHSRNPSLTPAEGAKTNKRSKSVSKLSQSVTTSTKLVKGRSVSVGRPSSKDKMRGRSPTIKPRPSMATKTKSTKTGSPALRRPDLTKVATGRKGSRSPSGGRGGSAQSSPRNASASPGPVADTGQNPPSVSRMRSTSGSPSAGRKSSPKSSTSSPAPKQAAREAAKDIPDSTAESPAVEASEGQRRPRGRPKKKVPVDQDRTVPDQSKPVMDHTYHNNMQDAESPSSKPKEQKLKDVLQSPKLKGSKIQTVSKKSSPLQAKDSSQPKETSPKAKKQKSTTAMKSPSPDEKPLANLDLEHNYSSPNSTSKKKKVPVQSSPVVSPGSNVKVVTAPVPKPARSPIPASTKTLDPVSSPETLQKRGPGRPKSKGRTKSSAEKPVKDLEEKPTHQESDVDVSSTPIESLEESSNTKPGRKRKRTKTTEQQKSEGISDNVPDREDNSPPVVTDSPAGDAPAKKSRGRPRKSSVREVTGSNTAKDVSPAVARSSTEISNPDDKLPVTKNEDIPAATVKRRPGRPSRKHLDLQTVSASEDSDGGVSVRRSSTRHSSPAASGDESSRNRKALVVAKIRNIEFPKLDEGSAASTEVEEAGKSVELDSSSSSQALISIFKQTRALREQLAKERKAWQKPEDSGSEAKEGTQTPEPGPAPSTIRTKRVGERQNVFEMLQSLDSGAESGELSAAEDGIRTPIDHLRRKSRTGSLDSLRQCASDTERETSRSRVHPPSRRSSLRSEILDVQSPGSIVTACKPSVDKDVVNIENKTESDSCKAEEPRRKPGRPPKRRHSRKDSKLEAVGPKSPQPVEAEVPQPSNKSIVTAGEEIPHQTVQSTRKSLGTGTPGGANQTLLIDKEMSADEEELSAEEVDSSIVDAENDNEYEERETDAGKTTGNANQMSRAEILKKARKARKLGRRRDHKPFTTIKRSRISQWKAQIKKSKQVSASTSPEPTQSTETTKQLSESTTKHQSLQQQDSSQDADVKPPYSTPTELKQMQTEGGGASTEVHLAEKTEPASSEKVEKDINGGSESEVVLTGDSQAEETLPTLNQEKQDKDQVSHSTEKPVPDREMEEKMDDLKVDTSTCVDVVESMQVPGTEADTEKTVDTHKDVPGSDALDSEVNIVVDTPATTADVPEMIGKDLAAPAAEKQEVVEKKDATLVEEQGTLNAKKQDILHVVKQNADVHQLHAPEEPALQASTLEPTGEGRPKEVDDQPKEVDDQPKVVDDQPKEVDDLPKEVDDVPAKDQDQLSCGTAEVSAEGQEKPSIAQDMMGKTVQSEDQCRSEKDVLKDASAEQEQVGPEKKGKSDASIEYVEAKSEEDAIEDVPVPKEASEEKDDLAEQEAVQPTSPMTTEVEASLLNAVVQDDAVQNDELPDVHTEAETISCQKDEESVVNKEASYAGDLASNEVTRTEESVVESDQVTRESHPVEGEPSSDEPLDEAVVTQADEVSAELIGSPAEKVESKVGEPDLIEEEVKTDDITCSKREEINGDITVKSEGEDEAPVMTSDVSEYKKTENESTKTMDNVLGDNEVKTEEMVATKTEVSDTSKDHLSKEEIDELNTASSNLIQYDSSSACTDKESTPDRDQSKRSRSKRRSELDLLNDVDGSVSRRKKSSLFKLAYEVYGEKGLLDNSLAKTLARPGKFDAENASRTQLIEESLGGSLNSDGTSKRTTRGKQNRFSHLFKKKSRGSRPQSPISVESSPTVKEELAVISIATEDEASADIPEKTDMVEINTVPPLTIKTQQPKVVKASRKTTSKHVSRQFASQKAFKSMKSSRTTSEKVPAKFLNQPSTAVSLDGDVPIITAPLPTMKITKPKSQKLGGKKSLGPKSARACAASGKSYVDLYRVSGTLEHMVQYCKPCSVKLVDLIKVLDAVKEKKSEKKKPATREPQETKAKAQKRKASEITSTSPRPHAEQESPPTKRVAGSTPSYEGAFLDFLQSSPPSKSPGRQEVQPATEVDSIIVEQSPVASPKPEEQSHTEEKPIPATVAEVADRPPNQRPLKTLYRCLFCRYTCHIRKIMEDHVYNHMDVIPYMCGLCYAIFGTRGGVLVHNRRSHKGHQPVIIKKSDVDETQYYTTMAEFQERYGDVDAVLPERYLDKPSPKSKAKSALPGASQGTIILQAGSKLVAAQTTVCHVKAPAQPPKKIPPDRQPPQHRPPILPKGAVPIMGFGMALPKTATQSTLSQPILLQLPASQGLSMNRPGQVLLVAQSNSNTQVAPQQQQTRQAIPLIQLQTSSSMNMPLPPQGSTPVQQLVQAPTLTATAPSQQTVTATTEATTEITVDIGGKDEGVPPKRSPIILRIPKIWKKEEYVESSDEAGSADESDADQSRVQAAGTSEEQAAADVSDMTVQEPLPGDDVSTDGAENCSDRSESPMLKIVSVCSLAPETDQSAKPSDETSAIIKNNNESVDTKATATQMLENLNSLICPTETGEDITSEEVWQCKFCEENTRLYDVMVSHVQTAHKKTYWYACPYCPFGCSQPRFNMYRHMRRTHPNKEDNIFIGIIDAENYFTKKKVPSNTPGTLETKNPVLETTYGQAPYGPYPLRSDTNIKPTSKSPKQTVQKLADKAPVSKDEKTTQKEEHAPVQTMTTTATTTTTKPSKPTAHVAPAIQSKPTPSRLDVMTQNWTTEPTARGATIPVYIPETIPPPSPVEPDARSQDELSLECDEGDEELCHVESVDEDGSESVQEVNQDDQPISMVLPKDNVQGQTVVTTSPLKATVSPSVVAGQSPNQQSISSESSSSSNRLTNSSSIEGSMPSVQVAPSQQPPASKGTLPPLIPMGIVEASPATGRKRSEVPPLRRAPQTATSQGPPPAHQGSPHLGPASLNSVLSVGPAHIQPSYTISSSTNHRPLPSRGIAGVRHNRPVSAVSGTRPVPVPSPSEEEEARRAFSVFNISARMRRPGPPGLRLPRPPRPSLSTVAPQMVEVSKFSTASIRSVTPKSGAPPPPDMQQFKQFQLPPRTFNPSMNVSEPGALIGEPQLAVTHGSRPPPPMAHMSQGMIHGMPRLSEAPLLTRGPPPALRPPPAAHCRDDRSVHTLWTCPYCTVPNQMTKSFVERHIRNCHPEQSIVYVPFKA